MKCVFVSRTVISSGSSSVMPSSFLHIRHRSRTSPSPVARGISKTSNAKTSSSLLPSYDEKEQAPRSCWNKFNNVMSFLKAQGIRGIVKKNDWPRFTEEEPEVYEREELDRLLAACDDEERLWFEVFLMTGMREQEVMYTYWSDVNFTASTVRVSHKPDRGWTPKAYKEREIPIPAKLVTALKGC